MKKRTPLILAGVLLGWMLMVMAIGTAAVTADSALFPTEQPDGTALNVRTYGDEYFHWNEDDNGWLIAYNEDDRTWYYAETDENDNLVPGSDAVGDAGKAGRSLAKTAGSRLTYEDIAEIAEEKAEASRAAAVVMLEEQVTAGISEGSSDAPSAGTSDVQALKNNAQDLLLLLIEYSDISMHNTMDFWRDRYFGMEGNTVNTYYLNQSGTFGLHFTPLTFTRANGMVTPEDTSVISEIELKDGVARVRFNKTYPTGNSTAVKAAVNGDVKTAFSYVKEYIDFTKYTGNMLYSGYIRQEYFQTAAVIAGWEESANGSKGYSQKVWAHASYMYFGEIYDRIQVSVNRVEFTGGTEIYPPYSLLGYMLHGELYSGNPGTESAQTLGVGVAVHELGHCLGVSDLYDTGSDSSGLSVFSVMASGSWGARQGETQGTTPVGFDAWSKIKLGFAEPVVISASEKNVVRTLSASPASPDILKLVSPTDKNQYFLVENRQLIGYDAGLAYFGLGLSRNNGGICIYHIDDAVNNSVKNPDDNRGHYGVELLFADGSGILRQQKYSYFSNYSPFFTADGYGEFHTDSPARSVFYTPGHTKTDNPGSSTLDYECHSKTVLSGISLKVLDSSGPSMQVRINMSAGDINGDGQVTAADRMLLARYLDDEWENSFLLNRYAADLNGDTRVDENDVDILKRYFAGWKGYESLPHIPDN